MQLNDRNRPYVVLPILAILITVYIVLSNESRKDDKDSSTVNTTTTVRTGATGTTTTLTVPSVQTQRVVVENGEPEGGIAKLEATKGERVRFSVTSDVADEVHVHGYDLSKNVAPGKPVVFSFPATIEGRFEVELEARGTQIARLEVTP